MLKTETKLQAALANAKRGFSVFPIIPNGKSPAINNWQNEATTDPIKIAAWWAQDPDYNVGISTRSLLVVDVDPRHGGDASLAGLKLTDDIPKTLVSATAGGGNHLVYALPEHTFVRNSKNKLGQGLDIRAYGGLIAAAGSTIDGKQYRWLNDVMPTLAPAWLIEKCRAPAAKAKAAGKRVAAETEAAIEEAYRWLVDRAPTAELGALKDTAYKVACRLFDYGLEEDTAASLLRDWGDMKCHPRLEDDTVWHSIRSAQTYRENPIGNRNAANASGFRVQEIKERPDAIASAAPSPSSTTPSALEWFADAAAKALTDTANPLIEGVLDRGTFIVTYGESGGGKSFLKLDQAYCVASGRPWLGHAVHRGAVLYLALEGGQGINKRLEALRRKYPEDRDVPLFVVKAALDLLRNKAHRQQVVQWAAEAAGLSGRPCELIVIDTLSRALCGGDENSPTDMGAYVGVVDALRVATGAAIDTIHHTGKDKSKGARGHSLLRAAADTEIEVNEHRMTVRKQRDDGELAPMAFRLAAVRLGADPTGRGVTSCTFEAVSKEEWRQDLTDEQQGVLDAVHVITENIIGATFRVAEVTAATKIGQSWESKDVEATRGLLRVLETLGWIIKNPNRNGYKLRVPKSQDAPKTTQD